MISIGYPSETNADFIDTLKLINKVKFINTYLFIFSARPGTPAFNLNKVDIKDVKNRLIDFQNIAGKIKINYRNSLIGKTTKVLFENKMKNKNKYFGRDEYFNSVVVSSNNDLTGKINYVKIMEVNQNTLFGEIISDINQNICAA